SAQPQPAAGTHGTVTGRAWALTPLNGGVHDVALVGIDVVVKQGATTHLVRTDANGKYALPTVSGSVVVSATLSGPHCKISTAVGNVLTASKAGTGQVDLKFAVAGDPETALAQVTAFHGVNAVFGFAQPYFPNGNPGFLNGLPTRVNINQRCHANYTPSA